MVVKHKRTNIFRASEKPEATKKLLASMESLRSNDIAEAVVYSLSAPAHVDVNEMIIRPVEEPF